MRPRPGLRPLVVLMLLAILAPPVRSQDAAGTPTPPPAPASDVTLAARVAAWLAPLDAADQLSGTLLVARNGTVLLEASYGYANRELGVRFTPTTRSCIASITKPITIALVCRLIDDRRMLPSDSLAKWLPDFPRADRITISHLLNHRAGIPHRVTTREQECLPRTPADMTALAAKAEFHCEPGEMSVYSSAGFSVLARACELAAGQSFGELLRTRIFEPAGMTRSVNPEGPELIPDRAASYAHVRDGVANAPLRDLSYLVGAGSLFSTPRDILAFMMAVKEGRLGPTAPLALRRDNGFRWNGITDGYRAFADDYSDTGLQVIWCGNRHIGAVDLLREALPKLAAGETPAPPQVPQVTAADVPREALLRCEGDFTAGPALNFSITAGDGVLNAGDWLLIPTSQTTFFSPQDYGEVTVVSKDGVVEGFDWKQRSGLLEWRRKPK